MSKVGTERPPESTDVEPSGTEETMVTSDILARGDAAVHVAHAFTTHADPFETDYFSALDELQKERLAQRRARPHARGACGVSSADQESEVGRA